MANDHRVVFFNQQAFAVHTTDVNISNEHISQKNNDKALTNQDKEHVCDFGTTRARAFPLSLAFLPSSISLV
jgi:hypothetical protein